MTAYREYMCGNLVVNVLLIWCLLNFILFSWTQHNDEHHIHINGHIALGTKDTMGNIPYKSISSNGIALNKKHIPLTTDAVNDSISILSIHSTKPSLRYYETTLTNIVSGIEKEYGESEDSEKLVVSFEGEQQNDSIYDDFDSSELVIATEEKINTTSITGIMSGSSKKFEAITGNRNQHLTHIKTYLVPTKTMKMAPDYYNTEVNGNTNIAFRDAKETHILNNEKLQNTLPQSVSDALHFDKSRSGYLLGNHSQLNYYQYPNDVDLRIIVIVHNRAKSLKKCLNSLVDVDYLGDRICLHVWIDRDPNTDVIPMKTYVTAKRFMFRHGQYYVHVQPYHVGIQGQWLNTWRPGSNSKEIGVIFEDDMTVSPFYYR